MQNKFKNLKKPRYPISSFVRQALFENDLMEKYKQRPAYQQNDYIGWINQAVQQKTKEKRLNKMLDELRDGHLHMKMESALRNLLKMIFNRQKQTTK